MSFRAFDTEDGITCSTCTDSLDIEHGAFRLLDEELDDDATCQRCGNPIFPSLAARPSLRQSPAQRRKAALHPVTCPEPTARQRRASHAEACRMYLHAWLCWRKPSNQDDWAGEDRARLRNEYHYHSIMRTNDASLYPHLPG
jgi:hypothetical protein